MNPNMPVHEMLNSFIYIVKGSRVIHRKGADWGKLQWMKESYSKSYVLSMADLRRYFSHTRGKWSDPFHEWFKHQHRLTAGTLSEAMNLADLAARGLIEPRIDVEAMIKADWCRKNEPAWAKVS